MSNLVLVYVFGLGEGVQDTQMLGNIALGVSQLAGHFGTKFSELSQDSCPDLWHV